MNWRKMTQVAAAAGLLIVVYFELLKGGEEANVRSFFQRSSSGRNTSVYDKRNALLRQTCDRLGPTASYGGLSAAPLGQLRWLFKRNFVMCFVPKVGTSTWLHYLLQDAYPGLLKFVHHQHDAAKRWLAPPIQALQSEKLLLLKGALKVIPVRHPFERLVSAYLDKVEPCARNRNCYWIKLSEEAPAGFSFEDFVRYLVRHFPTRAPLTHSYYTGIDRHWRPYYVTCAPCDIDYDYIIDMDTWERDTRFILDAIGYVPEEEKRYNSKNSTARAQRYFKDLPPALVLQLYEIYEIDFEMFGYTMEQYRR